MGDFSDKKYVTGNSLIYLANTTKNYVDTEIARVIGMIGTGGGGGDVSDSGVIDDSEFDDLISDTFGDKYVGGE